MIAKEGEKSRAVCAKCRKIVNVTYKRAPFLFYGSLIQGVLQGFCDRCGSSAQVDMKEVKELAKHA
jgi:hypothetical protein